MVNVIERGINLINNTLEPLTPTGVNGAQYISVFLIVYAIILQVIKNVKVLEDNRGAQLMISLVTAYFTASSAFSALLITKLFPNLGMVTMLLISFILIISLTQKDSNYKLNMGILLTIVGIALITIMTWNSMAGGLELSGLKTPTLTQDEWYGITFLGVFILIILLMYFAGGKKKEKDPTIMRNFMKALMGYEKK